MQDNKKMFKRVRNKCFISRTFYSPENVGKSLMNDFRKQYSLNYSNSINGPVVIREYVALKSN